MVELVTCAPYRARLTALKCATRYIETNGRNATATLRAAQAKCADCREGKARAKALAAGSGQGALDFAKAVAKIERRQLAYAKQRRRGSINHNRSESIRVGCSLCPQRMKERGFPTHNKIRHAGEAKSVPT